MISQEEILERVLSRVSDQIADSVKQTVTEAVQRELSSSMTKAMVESEFYRRLNEEMRLGLRGIYREITTASTNDANGVSAAEPDGADAGQTHKLFSDATRHIEEIMQTTLEATEKIMESTETLLEQQEEAGRIIATLTVAGKEEKSLARLDELNSSLEASLTDILTALSFQDLTGQRLKKVVAVISSIRETVFDLYVSTGLMMKTREEAPEKDIMLIAEESRRKVAEIKNSELKGPTLDASQKDVDDLLASLGM